MKLLKSCNPVILSSCALALSACATVTLWMDPIKQTGPNSYAITHSMSQYSPVKGVRSGVLSRARNKCTSLNLYYVKDREEITTTSTLDYTLYFTCTTDVPAAESLVKTKSKSKL